MEVLVFMILVRVDMVIAAMMMVHQAAIVVDPLHQMTTVPVIMDRLEVLVVPQEDTVALQEVTVVHQEDTVALQEITVVPREVMVVFQEAMVVPLAVTVVLQEVMEVL